MRLFLPLLLLAGCAAHQAPYNPVRDVRYAAIGAEPFWMVTIGDDKIVLNTGPDRADDRRGMVSRIYPRVLPRTVAGVRRWQSGDGTVEISIEARPGPCTGSRGARFDDQVRVRVGDRELNGCGGRRLRDPDGGRG